MTAKIEMILGDCMEVLKTLADNSINSIVTDPPYGLSFMGKKWDYDVPSVEIWKECLRVLKPGGYLLSFAGTRTQHRMACNIEDAGFEIRDMIAWVYGSGFPKSLNIGKTIDKLQGNEREKIGEISSHDITSGGFVGKEYSRHQVNVTKGTSDFEGWGTALKPACEPITVARKPLSEKTVAENCLKWGTGGINIDGCRVRTEDNLNGGAYSNGEKNMALASSYATGINAGVFVQPAGRWPANLIHDGSDEVLAVFPDTNPSKAGIRRNRQRNNINIYGGGDGIPQCDLEGGFNDSGSAARFFYCAKASKRDRDEGGEGLDAKRATFADGTGLRNNGDGTPRNQEPSNRNHHPTVKPTALMRYLCRLVTPPRGIVLDPFMGSGSTGKAAVIEGFNFIGIEREAEYVEIAEARINIHVTQGTLFTPQLEPAITQPELL
jgi:DNA modification methylase